MLLQQLQIWRPYINDCLSKSKDIINLKEGIGLEIGPTKGNVDQDSRYDSNPIHHFFSNFKIETGCLNTPWATHKIDITKYKSVDLELKYKYDLLFLIEVIEHTKKPWKIQQTTDFLLKKNGYLIISTPCLVGIHEGLDYGDYWRLLPASHQILFEEYQLIDQFVCDSNIGLPFGVFSIFKKIKD
jgi:hypothetical protein